MLRLLLGRSLALAALSIAALSVALAAPPAGSKFPIPVVFHTDIGTDIDDTWALAQLLRSPELDLKLVLVDTNDTRYRAKVAARLLEIAGRTDVPIGLGVTSPMREQEQNQLPWVHGYDLASYRGRVAEDGIGALIELVMNSPEPVTVISVGAVPALAQAIAREPRMAPKARFVGMHGSIDVGYGGGPVVAESNVKVDPAALRAVLAAPWRDVLLTPLDTCGNVDLDGADYHAVWCAISDPLLRAVIEGYCVFAPRVTWMKCDFFTQRSTTLFDCVAVYLAYSEDLVETETLRLKVTDDGFTVRDPAGPSARVALRWKDHAGFEKHLADRLLRRR